MFKRRLRKIYLAGPITGCNDDQKKVWRQRIERSWPDEFEFICPVQRIEASPAKTPYQIVSLDMEAIRDADAVIANMWKASIGTAIGVAVASFNGKPVIVIDRNLLRNATLEYYAYDVVDDEDEAMLRLKEYFRQQDKIDTVQKSHGRPDEAFSLVKLVNSLKKACVAAGQNDLLAPREVVPRVLDKLAVSYSEGPGTVRSFAIKAAVFEVLAELEGDEEKGSGFQRIRQAWTQYDKKKPDKEFLPAKETDIRLHRVPQPVRIHSGKKSHKLLWGKMRIGRLEDIPASARRAFSEICRVDGVEEVRFTGFKRASHDGPCVLELMADLKSAWITGSCFDKGKYGAEQFFKIKVRNPESRDAILMKLREQLRSRNHYPVKEMAEEPPDSVEQADP